eukprot:6806855-Pyramimonas_sp.AAC.1
MIESGSVGLDVGSNIAAEALETHTCKFGAIELWPSLESAPSGPTSGRRAPFHGRARTSRPRGPGIRRGRAYRTIY